jgi:cobalt-zinc-cadmium efflux system protein
MALAVGVTLAFVLGEAIAGYFANSLALLSDAGHNFADALALIFSYYGLWIARRPADAMRTFGYHRVGILAALVNAVSLVVIALFIFWEAIHRLWAPEPVQSSLMIGVALVAILVNGLISLWLRSGAQHDLNIRSAYLHMVGDAASALGILATGVVVALTNCAVADPIVSLLIGALILWSSWGILVEATNVLLEAVPMGLDMRAVERVIKDIPGVLNVHDLHVWSIGSGIVACSCHILVSEHTVRSGQQVIQAVAGELRGEFRITHTTVQVEVEGCEPNAMYCTLHRASDMQTGHDDVNAE